MSFFTIQIIISTHDTSFKKVFQKCGNWWIFALILLNKNQFSCTFLGLYYPYLKFISLQLNWNLLNHLNLNFGAQTCPNENSDFFFWIFLIRFTITGKKLKMAYVWNNPEKPYIIVHLWLGWHMKASYVCYNLSQ